MQNNIFIFPPEQWLATAATNGAVVLWNIQKSIKLKQETVYYDHKRTVNKVIRENCVLSLLISLSSSCMFQVTFHGSEQNMLLSGSQDGTMKYFDIRMKVAAMTFVRLEVVYLHTLTLFSSVCFAIFSE